MPLWSQTQQALRDAWQEDDALATILLVLFLDAYGDEKDEDGRPLACLRWAPETILHELRDDLGIDLPPASLSKLMAAIHLLVSDEFYRLGPAFCETCVILAGGPHTPGVFIPADAAACAWGITEAVMLSPPDDQDDAPFAEEIRAYIGEVLKDEGIIRPPDVLRLAAHDAGLMDRLQADYADDPEFAEAIWKAEDEKTKEIENFLKNRLARLIHTLSSLPLRQGNASEVARKVLKSLGQPA